jgi:hypothetical protein
VKKNKTEKEGGDGTFASHEAKAGWVALYARLIETIESLSRRSRLFVAIGRGRDGELELLHGHLQSKHRDEARHRVDRAPSLHRQRGHVHSAAKINLEMLESKERKEDEIDCRRAGNNARR